MRAKAIATAAGAALIWLASAPSYCATNTPAGAAASNSQNLAKIVPGRTTKADVRSVLGAPWREVQFNDCGMAMEDQADETWEYRDADANGGFRIHVEFGDDGVVHLIAKIPDKSAGGKATAATTAPAQPAKGMSM